MLDRITANLPSKDFEATVEFYGRLGFNVAYRGKDWLIMLRGDLEVEFFPHPEVDPLASWFSACIRVDDLDGLWSDWRKLGLPEENTATPRLTGIFKLPDAPRMFALVDPDGSLLRVLDNGD